MQRVLKNPRIVEGAAPNAHAGAAGFLEHLPGSLGRCDISIANDWNFSHRRGHGPDPAKIYRSTKTLLPCSPMDEQRGNTHVLQRPSELWRRDVLVVPPQPHFGGYGNFYRIDHSLYQRCGTGEFSHHR